MYIFRLNVVVVNICNIFTARELQVTLINIYFHLVFVKPFLKNATVKYGIVHVTCSIGIFKKQNESQRKILKSNGPKIDPDRTPYCIPHHELNALTTFILCFLLDR